MCVCVCVRIYVRVYIYLGIKALYRVIRHSVEMWAEGRGGQGSGIEKKGRGGAGRCGARAPGGGEFDGRIYCPAGLVSLPIEGCGRV